MRKDIKKIVAGILSATMLLGTSTMAFAETHLTSGGTNSNVSKVEGFVETDVFDVVLPTYDASTFSFTIDPQQLINKTNAQAYSGKKFESGATLFFMNSGAGNLMSDGNSGTYNYSHKSNRLTITNKSATGVSVTLEATLSSAGDILLSSDGTFVGDDAMISLRLVNAETEEGKAITSGGASDSATIAGAADAYDYLYSSGSRSYSYGLTSDGYAFETLSYYVEGSANPNGDFEDLVDAAPVLNVTWSVTDEIEAGIFYDDSTNDWWIGASEEEGFDTGVELGAVKVNDQSIVATVTQYDDKDWILVKWSDYVAAGYDQEETEYEFTAVINGSKYVASYTYEP